MFPQFHWTQESWKMKAVYLKYKCYFSCPAQNTLSIISFTQKQTIKKWHTKWNVLSSFFVLVQARVAPSVWLSAAVQRYQVCLKLMALLFVGFVSSCFSGSFSQEGCQLSVPGHPRGRLMSSCLPDHYTTCSPPQCCPLAAPPLEMLGWPLLWNHHEIVC